MELYLAAKIPVGIRAGLRIYSTEEPYSLEKDNSNIDAPGEAIVDGASPIHQWLPKIRTSMVSRVSQVPGTVPLRARTSGESLRRPKTGNEYSRSDWRSSLSG